MRKLIVLSMLGAFLAVAGWSPALAATGLLRCAEDFNNETEQVETISIPGAPPASCVQNGDCGDCLRALEAGGCSIDPRFQPFKAGDGGGGKAVGGGRGADDRNDYLFILTGCEG